MSRLTVATALNKRTMRGYSRSRIMAYLKEHGKRCTYFIAFDLKLSLLKVASYLWDLKRVGLVVMASDHEFKEWQEWEIKQ